MSLYVANIFNCQLMCEMLPLFKFMVSRLTYIIPSQIYLSVISFDLNTEGNISHKNFFERLLPCRSVFLETRYMLYDFIFLTAVISTNLLWHCALLWTDAYVLEEQAAPIFRFKFRSPALKMKAILLR
jgi:hypothetical protein